MNKKTYLIAFATIARKEVSRFLRIWPQTLLPPLVTMTLYFLIFGNLIGTQIGGVQGFTYMQYIAPGLIMMSVITNAYTNVVFSVYSARFQKSIEEMLISPMPSSVLLIGFVAGGVLRGLMTGLLVTLLALFFTHLHVHSIVMVIVISLTTTVLFSLAGFTNALFAKKFDDVSIVPTFVLTPLTYLGGVFYSIQMLGSIWQNISLFNPILYIVNAFRYSLLGVSDIPPYHALGVTFLCCFALFWLNVRLLNKGVGIRT